MLKTHLPSAGQTQPTPKWCSFFCSFTFACGVNTERTRAAGPYTTIIRKKSETWLRKELDGMENYKVIKALGQGTWGVVHMAEQKGTGRIVAIKKIKSERSQEGVNFTAVSCRICLGKVAPISHFLLSTYLTQHSGPRNKAVARF